MDIKNISALAGQLQSLEFENAGYALLKRICFKPDNFLIVRRIEKGRDQLSFQLYFEKSSKPNGYVLVFYDAIFQKEKIFEHGNINGVDLSALDNEMAGLDWKSAFEFDENKAIDLTDKSSWESEQKIEGIINDLMKLESTEEGKCIVAVLKQRYWSGSAYHELFGSLNFIKNKSEVSQRFYFQEGQNAISVDEAYRFLQNKWLEKQMQAKKKQTDRRLDMVA